MLNEKVGSLLNVQINKEFYSAYLYLEFSNFYKEKGLDGYANWYQIQACLLYTSTPFFTVQVSYVVTLSLLLPL